MRRCPKCNVVFENELRYCTHDGTELVLEEFPLPSEMSDDEPEEQTVIRALPVNIRLDKPEPPQQTASPLASTPASDIPVKKKKKKQKKGGGCFRYTIVLTIGLVLGVGLVVGAAIAGFVYFDLERHLFRDQAQNEERRLQEKENKPTPTPKVSSGPHKGTGSGFDASKINGKVIASRAVVRKTPARTGKREDVIPRGDRLEIIRRRSSTSAWYLVECEHGTRGWMHGNTIAYSK